ncbi:hypothetical protein MMC26_000906 [Xylographa opegraphella]|nr:hypothetical protein [Xylographa opegraphella]
MSAATVPVPPAPTLEPSLQMSDGDTQVYQENMTPRTSTRSDQGSPRSISVPHKSLGGLARRTLGIVLLLITVLLWTVSNFLASTIFADNSFSKPYFVTYLNTSFFSLFLLSSFIRQLWENQGSIGKVMRGNTHHVRYGSVGGPEHEAFLKPDLGPDTEGVNPSSSGLLYNDESMSTSKTLLRGVHPPKAAGLSVRDTAKLSLEFCLLWFAANYFIAACLEYTTVASSTILMSTSSIWTLLFGALLKVEKFTVKKMIGVLASLAGIMLISTVDLSGSTDENRGSFPHKSATQIAIGDILALGSAVLYGIYTIFMKKRIGDEGKVDMLLFFGFVGAFNMVTLWPGFLVLHFTGLETFELPPTNRIWTIVVVNSITSLVSDFCWAYAMLLTSPLVVTVGISLCIPLSLIGQMIINSQTSSAVYWIGACVVFLSFIFINHESQEDVVIQDPEQIEDDFLLVDENRHEA